MDAETARRRLEEERERLRALLTTPDLERLDEEGARDTGDELSAYDQHPADAGTETFEREKDQSIREQVEADLEDVERALERVAEGTYGTCEVGGEPIPDERLEALPATRTCVTHAGR